MDRFESLRLFTRIVELGSFTQAANALGIPRATATHAVKELERRLGTRLLERTTRQVRTTLDGQAYYERCSRILADLEEAESSLSAIAANPRGMLRVDLHGSHATRIILPRIAEFRQRYPDIELSISSSDRLVDLVREGIDCVVRAGHPRDSTLIVKRLALMPEVVCASPGYFARYGVPKHPDELTRHQAVGFFASSHDIRYPFTFQVEGEVIECDLGGWISVNDAECYTRAALSGCGLIQVPRFRVEKYLKAGRLKAALQEFATPGLPVSLLYPQHRQISPRVRVFVEWLTDLYRDRFDPIT